MARDFRFGIGLRTIKSADRLREKVRRFADLGYDVVHVPDHLGAPAPFPTMVAAAHAADTALLARAYTAYQLSALHAIQSYSEAESSDARNILVLSHNRSQL